jgi:monoamine oxidase
MPEPRTGTPAHRIAHQYLRDGARIPEPSRTRQCDVVVIGGGMSGLAAAFAARDAGFSTIVVEAESRAGGAAVSTRIGDASVPLGSVYFVSRTPELDALLHATDLTPVVCPEDEVILADGQVVRNLWSDATLRSAIKDERDRQGMQRFRDDLLAMGDALPSYPLAPTLSARDAALDGTSAADYMRRYGSRTADALINAYARSSMGAASTITNAYCLLNFYQSELGGEFGFSRYSFPGGTSALTQRLAKLHADDMQHGVAVRIETNAQRVHVEVIADDGSCVRIVADYAIVAAPKYQLPRLMPQMPAVQRDACAAMTYAPYVTIQIASSRPLQVSTAYDTWDIRPGRSYTDVINPIVLQSSSKQHVVSLYMACDIAERRMLMDDRAFAERVAKVVDEYAAGLTDEQRGSITSVHAWGWGHGIVVPTVGSHNGIAQRASAPIDRIVFAGTDNDAAPAIENAVANGFAAVKQVRRFAGTAGS